MQPQDRGIVAPPLEPSPSAEGAPVVRPFPEKPGILVVDDDHLVRGMIQLGLERNGFEVWMAANGQEALDLYREHRDRIVVALLDVCMPGWDGPRTLDALREQSPAIRACFMSGATGLYCYDDLRQRGAASVIAKPFYLDQLVGIMRLLAQDVPADLPPSDGVPER